MEWIELDKEEVCELPRPKDILFPEYRTNADTHLLCNKLKGHLSVADNQESMSNLIDTFNKMVCCPILEIFSVFQNS